MFRWVLEGSNLCAYAFGSGLLCALRTRSRGIERAVMCIAGEGNVIFAGRWCWWFKVVQSWLRRKDSVSSGMVRWVLLEESSSSSSSRGLCRTWLFCGSGCVLVVSWVWRSRGVQVARSTMAGTRSSCCPEWRSFAKKIWLVSEVSWYELMLLI